MNVLDLIKNKKLNKKHTFEELEFLIKSYVDNKVSDYQMTAWLMAVYFNGLSIEETSWLTKIMKDSGESLKFPADIIAVDKHSTGGVGDKVSIILVPLLASLDVYVPMISGRGLGHTGGTLDKLESISGFKVGLSTEETLKQVLSHKMAIVGQSEKLCPADKKMYALRDVTSTVDSIPLICASIMSKKLAEGISGLLMDVKYGSGAFMKKPKDALDLAKQLQSIGENNDVKTICMITNMNQPLGSFIGNSLEIKECVEILEGKSRMSHGVDLYEDVKTLVIHQAAHMLLLGKKVKSLEKALDMAKENLLSGKALSKFHELCHLQGAKGMIESRKTHFSKSIFANKTGYVQEMETENFGMANVALGGGRYSKEDQIDYHVGIELRVKIGMRIKKGDEMFIIHANSEERLNQAEKLISQAITLGADRVNFKLIKEII